MIGHQPYQSVDALFPVHSTTNSQPHVLLEHGRSAAFVWGLRNFEIEEKEK